MSLSIHNRWFSQFLAVFAMLITTGAMQKVSAQKVALQETSPRQRVMAAVGEYVNVNTVVVGYLNIDPSWIEGVQQEIVLQLKEQGLHEEGQELAGNPAFGMVRGMVAGLRATGGREVVMIIGRNDFHFFSTPNTENPLFSTEALFIITTTDAKAAKEVEVFLKGLMGMMPSEQAKLLAVRIDKKGNLLMGPTAAIERYTQAPTANRPDLLEPLAATFDTASKTDSSKTDAKRSTVGAALVLTPSADDRRVIRELFPELPAPFSQITGRLLADEIKHLVVSLSQPLDWKLKIELATRSEGAADKFKQVADAGYQWSVKQLIAELPGMKEVIQQAAQVLAVRQRGNSLLVQINRSDEQVSQLIQDVLTPAIRSSRESALRAGRMNCMKQLLLAMINFHAMLRQFPASEAIVDEEGKPLLSWRVAILPFLEQNALYDQFHFDEPWDSAHNIKLVKRMPSAFKSNNHPEIDVEGKTVFQLPVHAQTLFPPLNPNETKKKIIGGRTAYRAVGLEFKDASDGSSNTIMIVEMPPENAVVWTKPADWEVDLANAWQQLRGPKSRKVLAGFADGHVRTWSYDQNQMKTKLPKYLTRAGGEEID